MNLLSLIGIPHKAALWGAGIVAVIALLTAAWFWADAREKADDRANQEIGKTVEREARNAETIKQVEKANEIRSEIDRPGSRVLYDECVRSARNGSANCGHLLPERIPDDGSDAAANGGR